MPLDRLVLILVSVMIAGGATVWIGAVMVSSLQLGPLALGVVVPVVLVAYVIWRVIQDRLANAEDDHYDKIEK